MSGAGPPQAKISAPQGQRSGDSRKRGEPTSGLGNELPRSAPERAASQVLRPASLASRLGALLYEAVLLLAMAFVGAFALLPLISPAGADRSTLYIPPVSRER